LSGIIFKVNITNNKVSHAGGSNPIPLSKGFIHFLKLIWNKKKSLESLVFLGLQETSAHGSIPGATNRPTNYGRDLSVYFQNLKNLLLS
jgi:hypothetical protein